MITRIKMEVTQDLSERVQQIVFDNGGKWRGEKAKIIHTDEKYLYLNENKGLSHSYSDDPLFYEQHKYKEVSALDFISSQGEQGWLPDYGEMCEFSDDEYFQGVYTEKFKCYMPHGMYNYLATDGHFYKYCRPIKTKKITIRGLRF